MRMSESRWYAFVALWLVNHAPKLILLTVFLVIAYILQQHVDMALSWLQRFEAYAPYLFIFLYCLMSIFCLPNVLLVLAGGVVFGFYIGTILNLLGATLGAACGFCLSRYFLNDFFKFKFKHDTKMQRLMKQVDRRGWRAVALLRLMPMMPYNIVNYGLGTTSIKFRDYIIASAIFLIPNKLILTYCGYKGVDVYQALS